MRRSVFRRFAIKISQIWSSNRQKWSKSSERKDTWRLNYLSVEKKRAKSRKNNYIDILKKTRTNLLSSIPSPCLIIVPLFLVRIIKPPKLFSIYLAQMLTN